MPIMRGTCTLVCQALRHMRGARNNAFATNRALADARARVLSTLGVFPGTDMPFVPTLTLHDPRDDDSMPCFRRMGALYQGQLVDGGSDPKLRQDVLLQIYINMVRMNTMDHVLYDAQRQGRISFYATSLGEEAIHFGTASAIRFADMVFGQYREPGVLMWRGYSLQDFADQCCGNEAGHGLGRQTPMHYGSAKLHYQTIASPLATQIPHAAGAAYAFKLAKEDRIAVCYFGDGAASEGDCHAALNFAATRECPALFVCRNNGFAISTPTREQYRGDGIASRGRGYGMASMRVDGNDVLAVHVATRHARAFIREHNRPVLLEAMTYRQGHHSTSDDSTLYRDVDEVQRWRDELDPITRVQRYLTQRGWLTNPEDFAIRGKARADVVAALNQAERKRLPALETLFEDVYDVKPRHLEEQERDLLAHVAKYPHHYVGQHDKRH